MINRISSSGQPAVNRRYYRTPFKVQEDFAERNCKPARDRWYADDSARATRLTEDKYKSLLEILKVVGENHSAKVNVLLPRKLLETIPFEEIPPEEFLSQVMVLTLDLRNIDHFYEEYQKRSRYLPSSVKFSPRLLNPYNPGSALIIAQRDSETLQAVKLLEVPGDKRDDRVGRLEDAIGAKRKYFSRLIHSEGATVLDVIMKIDQDRNELGFKNMVLTYPDPDGSGRWMRSVSADRPEIGLSGYDPKTGGKMPTDTIKSIIENKSDQIVFVADIEKGKEGTFADQGLEISPSQDIDLENYQGPTEVIFARIKDGEEVLAVFNLHNRVYRTEVQTTAELLPSDPHERERLITALESYFLEAIRAISELRKREGREEYPIGKLGAKLGLSIPYVSKLLTDELLFDHKGGMPYPQSPEEYHGMIAKLLDEKGRFPGDTEPLTGAGTFSENIRGVDHARLKRKGIDFNVEIFSPHLHSQGSKNRLIFDVDLISQGASFDSYGTPGVSYDRENYYVGRLFNADLVPLIRKDGWPVSFAAMQGYQMKFQGQELFYAFIHFVMTRGRYQGVGLTSYSIREGLSSLYYSDVWNNYPNLMYDKDGKLKDYRFRLWAAAHSGRLSAFHAFVRSFGGIDPRDNPIAQAIFADVGKRIAPLEEAERKPFPKPMIEVNGKIFPVAVDRGVYPEHTRYPTNNGSVILPQSEKNLPVAVTDAWGASIEGEEGIVAGNAIYFGGLVTMGKIREAKRLEHKKESGGAEDIGNKIRGLLIRHTR